MGIAFQIEADMRFALQLRSFFLHLSPTRGHRVMTVKAFSKDAVENVVNKPSICTADELHYVDVANSDWRLALWRYYPHPQGGTRNHPLLLLSGVGTNAISYDLSSQSSFARYMSGQGFDTWILEVRGTGLSMHATHSNDIEQSAREISSKMESTAELAKEVAQSGQSQDIEGGALVDADVPVINEALSTVGTMWDESKLVTKLAETFTNLSLGLSGFLSSGHSRIMSARLFDQLQNLLENSHLLDRFNGVRKKFLSLLETNDNSSVSGQIKDLSHRLVNIFEEGHRSVFPQFFDLQVRFSATLEDFQKQLDLMLKYDWDLDHYLEEDIPAVIEYIRGQSKPKDDKLLAIGHSMGGILLYGMLSRCGKK